MKHFTILKKTIVILISFCYTVIAYSQTTVTIGSDASKNETCVAGGNNKYARSQHIYLASEIGATGTIGKIRVYIGNYTGIYDGELANFEVLIGTTSASTLSASWASVGSIVWSGNFNQKPTTGWVEFDITDFPFNGGADNLIIEFRHTDGGSFNQQPEWRYSGTNGAIRSIYGVSNTSFPPPATAGANVRPNIQLEFTSNSIPPPPPSGGSPTIDNLNVLNRIKIGQSIIIDGLSNTNPSNHIYTDATAPTDLLIQSTPSPANYNTIINANNTGNVGIGTITNPLAKLHVSNGGVLFDGTTGATPVSGAGTRMMWIPALNAFRAGFVDGTQWDDANIGPYSFACGFNAKASGQYSFATGSNSTATGNFSFVIGTGNTASGSVSSAFGLITTASGSGSSAFGLQTTASGGYSAAFGNFTKAESYASFATGQFNIPSPTASINDWVATDPLFVIGNGIDLNTPSNALTVLKNGNVGIGKTPPTEKLDVLGNININANKLYLQTGDINHGLGYFHTFTTTGNYANKDFDGPVLFGWEGGGLGTNRGSDRNVALSWNYLGQVGIGTPYIPNDFMLAVNGKIIAEEVNVKLRANWPDYVFENNYELRSIENLEHFIKQNCHLPEMPPTEEIEKNGINTSELITKLLKQQEELTLYIIEQNKRIEALENK